MPPCSNRSTEGELRPSFGSRDVVYLRSYALGQRRFVVNDTLDVEISVLAGFDALPAIKPKIPILESYYGI
jgi:hypothetical protein